MRCVVFWKIQLQMMGPWQRSKQQMDMTIIICKWAGERQEGDMAIGRKSELLPFVQLKNGEGRDDGQKSFPFVQPWPNIWSSLTFARLKVESDQKKAHIACKMDAFFCAQHRRLFHRVSSSKGGKFSRIVVQIYSAFINTFNQNELV